MRLYSAYINRKAAEEVNSVFEAERYVKKIFKDGSNLWELAKKEENDENSFEKAQEDSQIPDMIEDEKKEIKDIEDLANNTFKVIRESILLIHTQLNELKKLMKENEILKKSGFPIEIADQLEEMLKKEIISITAHLREMTQNIEKDKTIHYEN